MYQIKRGWLLVGALTATLSACSGKTVEFSSQGGSANQNGGQANLGGSAGSFTGYGGATTGLGGSTNEGGGSASQGGSINITFGGSTNEGGSVPGFGGSTNCGGWSSPGLGGSTNEGGLTGLGGSTSEGGSTGWGGSVGLGGSTGWGGATSLAGSPALGGSTSQGGWTANGGSAPLHPGTTPLPGEGVYDCVHVTEECNAAPNGHVVPYSTEEDLTSLIVGPWLRCSTSGFPESGVGILISADHTWHTLLESSDGSCLRVTTGFDDYGTWAAEKIGDSVRFKLVKSGGAGTAYFPAFSDTGRARLDPNSNPIDYVKAPTLE
jgi:hypothetical protein